RLSPGDDGPPADDETWSPTDGGGWAPNPVQSLTAEALTVSTAALTLELAADVPVAVACVGREDPAEAHLLETRGAGEVALPLGGLLASTDYDCTAAASAGEFQPQRASFRTPDPPVDLTEATVVADPTRTMTGAYTVMTVRPECYGRKNQIAVLDPDGRN